MQVHSATQICRRHCTQRAHFDILVSGTEVVVMDARCNEVSKEISDDSLCTGNMSVKVHNRVDDSFASKNVGCVTWHLWSYMFQLLYGSM